MTNRRNGETGSAKTWVEAEREKSPGFAARVEEERLVYSAAEILAEAMEAYGVRKSQLAAKLGKSKAYVTQLLDGGQNLTLRTLARVVYSLGFRIQLQLLRVEQEKLVILRRVMTLKGDADETTTMFASPMVHMTEDSHRGFGEPIAACG